MNFLLLEFKNTHQNVGLAPLKQLYNGLPIERFHLAIFRSTVCDKSQEGFVGTCQANVILKYFNCMVTGLSTYLLQHV